MFKKALAMILTGMLVTAMVGPSSVKAQSVSAAGLIAAKDDLQTTKMRTNMLKFGVGEKVRVEVKLRDNSKLKGYIGEAKEDSFTIVDSQKSSSQRFAYNEVQKVQKAGGGFSTRSWIILGAAIAGAVATWIIIKPALCDGGAQTRGPC